MSHRASPADLAFAADFAAGRIAPAAFDHAAHLRLAYVFLTAQSPAEAHRAMRQALQTFLAKHGVDPARYHETLTQAWVLAVRHFMDRTPDTASAEELLAAHPQMRDTRIMLTHYSPELLHSAAARAAFVAPDLSPIPGAAAA